ncbi:ASCH domain-containing protein [Paenibacillus sp. P46E]|uniref:ASCH domain-containing protein n=1 Tax=Paenibacillus sp. P46E TaxID=1349436 RepID=UPI000938C041|nr:ASCH domain-containing protein [Paenibacillus sp. P46E]OKP95084.1 2-oxoglutarate dehydrogenase E1 [Paenibacillus sp. P46E]
MKAITIKQPWATLIAIGEKQFETRGWSTKHRGEIAIHAGKRIDKAACEVPEIKAALARHGYTADNLPTGAVLATATMVFPYQVEEDNGSIAVLSDDSIVQGDEIWFGDFSQGRYAWELADVKQLSEPVPAKGKLSLWEWEGAQPL